MAIPAGELDRRVTIFRLDAQDDGMSSDRSEPVEAGKRWMKRNETSDGERLRAMALGAVITARFTARLDSLTAAIRPPWQLQCGGTLYEVTGIKEIGLREGVEITTKAILQ